MSCGLLLRLFQGRRTHAPSVPSLPVQTASITDLARLCPSEEQNTNAFLLGCCPEQGQYSLIVDNIPTSSSSAFADSLLTLPGVRALSSEDKPDHTMDITIQFNTSQEAATVLTAYPSIEVDGTRRVLRYADVDPDAVEPAAKRIKISDDEEKSKPRLRCTICADKIRSSYSKPCFICSKDWCRECVKRSFQTALGDPERFPVKCCRRITHYDVARGILSDEDYKTYKHRYEVFSTTKPIYCADSSCSTFLPPRIAKVGEKSRIICPMCTQVTCTACKILVRGVDEHTCTIAKEQRAFLKKFDYKQCPHCEAGVARMFGCSHMRCQCGAHWCWDCRRPLQMCRDRPCLAAGGGYYVREDDDEDELSPDPEVDTNTTERRDSGTAEREAPAGEETSEEVIISNDVTQTATTHTTIPNNDTETSSTATTTQIEEINPLTENPPNVGQPQSDADLEVQQGEDDRLAFEQFRAAEETLLHILSDDPAIHPPPDTQDLASIHPQLVPRSTPSPPPAPPPPPPPVEENLDREELDWENTSLDFGEEPIEESWHTAGCLHQFSSVKSKEIHTAWLPDVSITIDSPADNNEPLTTSTSEKHIDCLRCYQTLVFTQQTAEATPDIADETTDAAAAAAAAEPVGKPHKKKRSKNQHSENVRLFRCTQCGVFYCFDCKIITAKEFAKAGLKRT